MGESGFTLLEALVVITFVGLLAGVGFPQIAKVRTRFAVRGAVNAFMSLHPLARTTAIRQGEVAELHIDATNDLLWVEVDTSAAGSGVMDTVGFVIDLSDQNVALSSTQSLLCFDGRGLPSAASGCATSSATVIFSNQSEADTIETTVLGKIMR